MNRTEEKIDLFSNIGTLAQELERYLFMYNIELDKELLKQFSNHLYNWHKQGNSCYTWMYDIIYLIKKNKTRRRYKLVGFLDEIGTLKNSNKLLDSLKTGAKTIRKDIVQEITEHPIEIKEKEKEKKRNYYREKLFRIKNKLGLDSIEQAEEYILSKRNKKEKKEALLQEKAELKKLIAIIDDKELQFTSGKAAIEWYSYTYKLEFNTAKNFIYKSLRTKKPTKHGIFFKKTWKNNFDNYLSINNKKIDYEQKRFYH